VHKLNPQKETNSHIIQYSMSGANCKGFSFFFLQKNYLFFSNMLRKFFLFSKKKTKQLGIKAELFFKLYFIKQVFKDY